MQVLTGVRVVNRAIFSDSVDFTFFWNFILQNSLSQEHLMDFYLELASELVEYFFLFPSKMKIV